MSETVRTCCPRCGRVVIVGNLPRYPARIESGDPLMCVSCGHRWNHAQVSSANPDEEFQAKVRRVAMEVLEDETRKFAFSDSADGYRVLTWDQHRALLDQIAEAIAGRVARETM